MAPAKGKQIKVKAKLEVYELTPAKTRQKILGKEHKLKFKPIQVGGNVNVVNKDFKDLTPKSFPDDLKSALRLDLALFHVRAEQELGKIEKAKNDREKTKAKNALKQVLEKTAKDMHKKARDFLEDLKESAGKETKGLDPPKGADKTMKAIGERHEQVQKAIMKVTENAKTAYDKLAAGDSMEPREKKKHLDPLKSSIIDYTKEMKQLKGEMKKGAVVTKKMNVKDADNETKKLMQTAKAMQKASKAFESTHSGSEKKLAMVPSKLATGQYKSWSALTNDIPDHKSQADSKFGKLSESITTGLKKASKNK